MIDRTSGSEDLDYLLREADPILDPHSYVFVSLPGAYGEHAQWEPIASFTEREGLTLVIRQHVADAHALPYDGVFRRITLQVHSSLAAVGLTAGFATCLAAAGIGANVFAGYFHDHIFVPAAAAQRAMAALANLAARQ